MPLVVRIAKAQDLPVLETLEAETVHHFPTRKRWLETFREMMTGALSEEPEGFIVAEFQGRPVGAALVRVRGPHPVTGVEHGVLQVLTVAPSWRAHGVREQLLQEAEAYLKSKSCQLMATSLRTDAGSDGDLYKAHGFTVASWELERTL
ncbi:MAG: hypothetical protein DI536_17095 [Archangium gephyra]|uniref:N-acetyltransferase domain-containing protein n=1 Tax=Archangium gephyra TaxID=48 RepID=A0A2W5THF2_9BACT|nr:MAG: hypothetical protein DI536_17095 [Archangium gephyra]